MSSTVQFSGDASGSESFRTSEGKHLSWSQYIVTSTDVAAMRHGLNTDTPALSRLIPTSRDGRQGQKETLFDIEQGEPQNAWVRLVLLSGKEILMAGCLP